MKREDYIDKLVAFAKLKWNIDKATESEIRLALEMMPDRNDDCNNNCPFKQLDDNPEKYNGIYKPRKIDPYDMNIALMYGCPIPEPIGNTITAKINDADPSNVTRVTGKIGEDLFYTSDDKTNE